MDSGGIYLVNADSGSVDLIYSKGLSSEFVNNTSHYDRESVNAQMIMLTIQIGLLPHLQPCLQMIILH